MTDDQQHTENEQTQIANQTQSSSNKVKCKSCIAEFNTLNQCLSHELVNHFDLFETKCKRKQSSRCVKRKKQSSHDCPETKYLQNTVIAILSQCTEGKELDYLCRIFQPNPEDFSSLYHSVLVDLNADLMKLGKQWEIKPFGSTIMGLEFKESDFDFLVYPLDEEVNYQNCDNVYKQVEKVLRHSKHFSRVITIPKARVPIIKCTHNATQYNLDINVSSVLGVNNSKFIVKLFELDTRIHPLMLIIKIWAKYWNISGSGRISNYCLTLMVIAYLQNMKPIPILPSIQELQNNTEEMLVEGINYAFNENYINENGKKNHKKIKELLHGFFEFYSKFDFSSNIISTYLGKMINRNDFQTKKFVFPEYDKLMDHLKVKYPPTNIKRELHCEPIKLDSLIVIQDPFCLNHNNSAPFGKSIFDSFRIHLANGYRICSEFSSSTTNQRTSELLLRLFFERPIPPQSSVPKFTVNTKLISSNGELKKENTVRISTTFAATTTTNAICSFAADTTTPTNVRATATNNKSYDISSIYVDKCMVLRIKPIEVELMYVRTYLRKAFPNKSFNKIDINKFWIEKIIEFTRNILQDIFQVEIIDCNNEKNSPNSKVSRTNLQQTHIYHNNNNKIDDDDDDLKRLTMICELKATIDTWSSRRNDIKKLATYLNEQLEMTKNFQNSRTADKFPGNLHCKLCLKPEQNFCALSLTMEDLMPNKSTTESVTMQQNKSNMKIFFTQYTSRMSYFHKAYFEKLATFRK